MAGRVSQRRRGRKRRAPVVYAAGMTHLLTPDSSVVALVVRAAVVYLFLLLALRLAGRRELAQMTSFDLVLLLVISNAVQNSINAGDNSLTGGLVSAVVLVALNWAVGWVTYRSRPVERLLQGRPLRVVTDGKVHFGAMRKELITLAELRSALRKQGIARISDCREVVLEPDGTLSAVRRDVVQRPARDLAHPDPRYVEGAGSGI
jgi:uncharacterized membrane protein YcaP (DUF421 family)